MNDLLKVIAYSANLFSSSVMSISGTLQLYNYEKPFVCVGETVAWGMWTDEESEHSMYELIESVYCSVYNRHHYFGGERAARVWNDAAHKADWGWAGKHIIYKYMLTRIILCLIPLNFLSVSCLGCY